MWGYKKKSETQKKALTRPCWHPDLGPPASRTVINKFVLFIRHLFCYSSPNRLRYHPPLLQKTVPPLVFPFLVNGTPSFQWPKLEEAWDKVISFIFPYHHTHGTDLLIHFLKRLHLSFSPFGMLLLKLRLYSSLQFLIGICVVLPNSFSLSLYYYPSNF